MPREERREGASSHTAAFWISFWEEVVGQVIRSPLRAWARKKPGQRLSVYGEESDLLTQCPLCSLSRHGAVVYTIICSVMAASPARVGKHIMSVGEKQNRTLSIDSSLKVLPAQEKKDLIIHKHKYLTVGPWVESYTTFNECVKLADSSALHKLHTENSSDRPAVPLNISHSLCQLSWHTKERE